MPNLPLHAFSALREILKDYRGQTVGASEALFCIEHKTVVSKVPVRDARAVPNKGCASAQVLDFMGRVTEGSQGADAVVWPCSTLVQFGQLTM